MEIGHKIRAARQASKLTQEFVAEQLDVSRQTISNWENNKTYPDIVSVIRMSDLYSISLDELLKEDKNMMKHLEESTNVVRSRNKLSKLILMMAYLVVWVLLLTLFWFGTDGSDAMGFGLLAFYIVLPVATAILSFIIGKDHSWGKHRWLMILFFGVMFMLMEYGTFSLANMISNSKLNMPELSAMLPGMVSSSIGMLIGVLFSKKHRK